MSNVKGYSLKYNIYVHFVVFFILDKIVKVQKAARQKPI